MTRKTQKKLRKLLTLVSCAALLICVTIGATVAYLTSQDEVKNTFTVGKVAITLDEADVNEDGNAIEGADRVKANSYKLMPGHTYTKDPTVTVVTGSEECYVRMIVTVSNIANVKEAFPVANYPEYYNGDVFLLEKLVGGWVSTVWPCTSATAEGVYEFRYKETVKTPSTLPALFNSIIIPGSIENDALNKLDGISIDVVAHAIQADGFKTADAAWAAFAAN